MMYQVPRLMISRMISTARAIQSLPDHRACRPYGLSVETAALAAGADGAGTGVIAGRAGAADAASVALVAGADAAGCATAGADTTASDNASAAAFSADAAMEESE